MRVVGLERNVVGNNLQFNAPSQSGNWNDPDDEQLGSLMIYRDALKQNLTTPYKAGGSSLPKYCTTQEHSTKLCFALFSRMRLGRAGGFWRHIKQTNTYSGSNLAFVDGCFVSLTHFHLLSTVWFRHGSSR